jgi:aquaporin Z
MKKYRDEFIGTFVLVLAVGTTVVAPHATGELAPLAIGFTLMTMAFARRPVSGGAFNPAVAADFTVMKLAKVSHRWIYLIANPGAGAPAACVFRTVNPEDKQLAVAATQSL